MNRMLGHVTQTHALSRLGDFVVVNTAAGDVTACERLAMVDVVNIRSHPHYLDTVWVLLKGRREPDAYEQGTLTGWPSRCCLA